MWYNYDLSENALIEKKVFNSLLQQVDLSYQDLHEKYQEDFPESMNEIGYVSFANWFVRGGMKLRRIMSILALIKHTIVIVPAGATVTVMSGEKKSAKRVVSADTITVFAANEQKTDIRVETLFPQPIGENVEAPFRKRRSVTAKEKERDAENQAFAALIVSKNESDRNLAAQKLAEAEAAAKETQAAALIAAQKADKLKAAVEKAVEERQSAREASTDKRIEQWTVAQNAVKKAAIRKELKAAVQVAMRAAAEKNSAAKKIPDNSAAISEAKSAAQKVSELKILSEQARVGANEAKKFSAQKRAEQSIHAQEMEKVVALVKELKVSAREAAQEATEKEAAAKKAADYLAAMKAVIEQAKAAKETAE